MASDVSRADRFISQAAPFEQRVYFLCLRIMGSRQDAEDCAQESMLRAFRAYDGFGGIPAWEPGCIPSPPAAVWTPCAGAGSSLFRGFG